MLGSVRRFPRCSRSRFGCRSNKLCLQLASCPIPPTCREGTHTFPALVCWRTVPRSDSTVPSPQTSSVECLCCLQPFALHPSCCYRLHTCLTPFLLRLLPSSTISHRTPAPASCVVSVVCTCSHVCCSSAPRLRWPPTRFCFRPSRHASPTFSLLAKGRPCHIGELCSRWVPLRTSSLVGVLHISCHGDCFILSRESPTDPVRVF